MKIIPAEVQGYFRKHRTWTQMVLLVIFLGLPWIDVGGTQSILLNIPDRKFAILGVVFRAHETPLLFFIVAIGILSLALMTSVFGRVWCGWACPQTVFIDAIYRRIEIWIEGNYIERRKLESSPLDAKKMFKKSIKWTLFFFVSSLIAHSFMAYFVGSRELLQMMGGSPDAHWNYFLIITFFTALILFDFALFREQFCIYACPYGRLQNVLLDPSSMAVVYDENRGEPRKGVLNKGTSGDCVSCSRCVQVCPTGIDIRNGLQMECINCTACIDACDEIMVKVKKPTGLIGYKTLNGSKFNFFKAKPLIYLFFLIVCIAGLIFSLSRRQAVDISVLRGIGSPYSKTTDTNDEEFITNHFRLHIFSQSSEDGEYELTLPEAAKTLHIELVSAQKTLTVSNQKAESWHFFIKVPLKAFATTTQIRSSIRIQNIRNDSQPLIEKEIILIGPTL